MNANSIVYTSNTGYTAEYARLLGEKTGLPVVQLCGIRRKVHPKARCILDAGPAEFLSLFQNASYVCTNSFHGTVFSVQFQKPFFTAVAPSELAAPERSRTFSILSRLGLTDRIIGKGDTADLETEIDWAGASERLVLNKGFHGFYFFSKYCCSTVCYFWNISDMVYLILLSGSHFRSYQLNFQSKYSSLLIFSSDRYVRILFHSAR